MYAELDVDECDKCGGLFVESSMLNRIVEARDRGGNLHLHCALPRRDRWHEQMVRYLPCPACTKPMNRKVFAKVSGIIIDACREHGVWFDAGELTDALEFVSKGGLEEARKKELLALDDARRAHRSAENAASAVTMGVARPAGRPLERFAGGIIAGVLVDAWLG